MSTPDARPVSARAAAGWILERRADGRLDFVDAEGARHGNVDVLRAFPVTAPAGAAAVVAATGGELAWIEAVADLEPELRALVEAELAARELVPVIERIESVSDSEPAEWNVVTDRGRHTFKVRHGDDIERPADGSATITDTHGMRYVIPDIAKLGPRGRRLFEKMI